MEKAQPEAGVQRETIVFWTVSRFPIIGSAARCFIPSRRSCCCVYSGTGRSGDICRHRPVRQEDDRRFYITSLLLLANQLESLSAATGRLSIASTG
jgi:hypothetical protein